MTIICAIKSNDGVWIGSDTRVIDQDGFIFPEPVPKWLKLPGGVCGDIWVGWSGHARVVNLLKSPRGGVFKSIEDLAHRLYTYARDDGWTAGDGRHGEPVDYAYELLAVFGGEVYHLHGTGCVLHCGNKFVAAGSGRAFAYGAASVEFDWANRHGEPASIGGIIESVIQYDSNCGGEPFVHRIAA